MFTMQLSDKAWVCSLLISNIPIPFLSVKIGSECEIFNKLSSMSLWVCESMKWNFVSVILQGIGLVCSNSTVNCIQCIVCVIFVNSVRDIVHCCTSSSRYFRRGWVVKFVFRIFTMALNSIDGWYPLIFCSFTQRVKCLTILFPLFFTVHTIPSQQKSLFSFHLRRLRSFF